MRRKIMIDDGTGFVNEVNDLLDEKLLTSIIEEFYQNKQQLDYYKKETDTQNKEIKDIMNRLEKTEIETDNGIVAKMSIQKRENFMEDKLIAKLKELDILTPIKTIEVVDMDELENVIYNGGLDASELTSCKQTKEITVLKVAKKKGE